MKTIVKELILIETKEDLLNALKIGENSNHQFTAQELVNGRSYLFGQWCSFELSNGLKTELIDDIVTTLGGHYRTKENIKCSLMYGKPQHWGLSRMLFEPRVNSFRYCAGQDYTWETQQIRNALK